MEFYAVRLDKRTFDVFEGKQYHPDFWSRLRAGKNGVYVAQGRSLPHPITKKLASSIDPHQKTQLITLEQ